MARGQRVNITKEELEELYKNQGLNCKAISIMKNCSESLISQKRTSFGIPKIYQNEIHLDEEKLKRLVEQGHSQTSLASEFKTSTTTIKNKMRKMGIKSCGKPGCKPNGENITTWGNIPAIDVIKEPTFPDIKRIVQSKYKIGRKVNGYKIVKYYPNFVQTENKCGGLVGFTYADLWKEDLVDGKVE